MVQMSFLFYLYKMHGINLENKKDMHFYKVHRPKYTHMFIYVFCIDSIFYLLEDIIVSSRTRENIYRHVLSAIRSR